MTKAKTSTLRSQSKEELEETVIKLSKRVDELELEKKKAPAKKAPKTKRAPGAYALYVKENFAAMKEKHPDAKAPEIMSKIAVQWKEAKAAKA